MNTSLAPWSYLRISYPVNFLSPDTDPFLVPHTLHSIFHLVNYLSQTVEYFPCPLILPPNFLQSENLQRLIISLATLILPPNFLPCEFSKSRHRSFPWPPHPTSDFPTLWIIYLPPNFLPCEFSKSRHRSFPCPPHPTSDFPTLWII